MPVETPHFAVPFRISAEAAEEVEQDTEREIELCVEAVLRTPVGTRIEQPGFGRPDETFAQQHPPISADLYLAALAEWEPRARVPADATLEDTLKRIAILPEA